MKTSLIIFISLLSAIFILDKSYGANDSTISSSPEIERLQVTGSYIKRMDAEGPSPLDIIDRDEFDLTGSTIIADALKENVAFEAVFDGPGHVRFRGQHAGNVLILLNGMRLPKQAGGYYTSINGIPTSALERIELLKDGGSALYGSDAMSGVMNFITRDSFDGAEFSMSSTLNNRGTGNNRSYSATVGRSFARGHLLGVVQLEESDSYKSLDVGSFNNNPNFSDQKKTSFSLGNDNDKMIRSGSPCPNSDHCESNPILYNQARPDNQNISTLITGKYEFIDVDLNVLALFNRRESTSYGRPFLLSWRDQRNEDDGLGPNNALDTNQMQPSSLLDSIIEQDLASEDGFVDFQGRFGDQFGDNQTTRKEKTLSLQAKLSGPIGHSWEWHTEVGYAHINSENRITHGEFDQNIFRDLIHQGKVDLTEDGVISQELDRARISPAYKNSGHMINARGVFTGHLFDLYSLYPRGGSVNMAVGVEVQNEDFKFNNDRELTDGSTLRSPSDNFKGKRNVQSVFMEIAAFPLENLEVQLAHRFDHYSDVGDTYNPKLALSYKPFYQLMLRSSIGTGFRAPGITDLRTGTNEFQSNFRDQANCDDEGCLRQFYDVTTFNDENIKPEDSLHYSFGAIYEPTRNINISIDQWNFKGKNTLSAIRAEEFTFIENEYGRPQLESIGVETIRDENGDLVRIIHPRVLNMGERTLRGIDIGAEASFNTDIYGPSRVILGWTNSYTITRRTKKFDFAEEEKGNSNWKNRLSVALARNRHFFRVSALTVSSDEIVSGNFVDKIPQYTEYDFAYNYRTSWGGRFNLVVKNLSNTRPPVRPGTTSVDYTNISRNHSSFSPLRRRFYVAYSQSF